MQSQLKEKIPEKVGKLWCRVRFNRIPEKILEKLLGNFETQSSQIQQSSGKNLGGAGIKSSQVVQCFKNDYGESVASLGTKSSQVYYKT